MFTNCRIHRDNIPESLPESGILCIVVIVVFVVFVFLFYLEYYARKGNPTQMALSENSEQLVLVRWLRRNRVLFCAVPNGEYVGCALEMKREGAKMSSVRKEQRQWLSDLAERGWATLIGFGADDAISKLKGLGYGG